MVWPQMNKGNKSHFVSSLLIAKGQISRLPKCCVLVPRQAAFSLTQTFGEKKGDH